MNDKALIKDLKKQIAQLSTEAKQAKINEEKLLARNQQLRATEQQLKAANQQLEANEQELQANNQQLIASEQQLRAANQQLQASEQQLRAANQQLEAGEQQLRAANQQLKANEEEIKENLHDLGERVKELDCLYKLSEIANSDKTTEKLLQATADIIPESWHYPEITSGCVILDGKKYTSSNYKESKWVQKSDIKTGNIKRGEIKAYYHKKKPELYEGPFMKEERLLINSISEIISEAIERKDILNELNKSRATFKQYTEEAPLSIFVTDTKGNYTYVNQHACDLSLYSEIELLSMSINDLIAENNQPYAYETFKTLKKEGKIEDELLIRRKNGTKFWARINFTPIFNSKNKIVGIIGISYDISDIKKTQRQLKNSQKRYKSLSDATFESIIFSKNALCLDQNLSAEEIFGYSTKEAKGKNLTEWFTIEEREKVSKNILNERTEAYRSKGLRKDGSSFPCEIQARMVTINNERIRITAIRDITSKIKTEQSLQISEAKYRSVVNNTSEGIFVVSKEGKIVYANPTIIKLSGFSENEIRNYNFTQFVYPEDRSMVIQNNLRRFKGEEMKPYDFRILDKNNNPKWVSINATKINWEGENAILCLISDIEDRKIFEEELVIAKEKAEESEKKLIEAQKLSKVGSWEYFTENDEVRWSKELYNIFELSEDLSAPKFSKQQAFYTKESFTLLEKAVDECVTNKKPYEVELDIITTNGHKKQIISKGDIIKDDNNNVIGAYGTAQDITAQKKLELALIKAKEKAEESDRLKSAFLANMSHEIRTPMNGILGFTSILEEPGLSPAQRKEFIKRIDSSGKRMLNTLNDLIDISKIEADQVSLNFKKSNIKDCFNEVFSFFTHEAEKNNIELIKNIPEKEICIKTDQEKIDAVLINLIKNAIKFTEKGKIEVGYKKLKKRIRFYVIDTGMGIPYDRQKHIFKRFVQADVEDRKALEGSGLGLAISESYIKLMNGEIWFDSVPGKGTDFYFEIPIK